MSSGLYNNWLAETEGYYNQYHGNTSFNGTTTKAVLGQTVTITDTSNKLSAYQSFSQTKDGVTFSHNKGSNDLTISVSSNCTADTISFNSRDYGLYQLMPNGSQYNSSTMSNYMYFTFTSGTVQNLMFSNYVDPSAFSINVQVEYGNALLIKTNSVGNTLSGAKFGLYKDANCTNQVRTGISNSNGQIEFNRLAPGTYYVKELSVPNGYLLDTSVQSVEVKVNETSQVTFKNYEPTGEIKITKTDCETGNKNRIDGTSHHGDATLDCTEYTLYAKDNIYNLAGSTKYFSVNEEIATYTFDSNGIANIKITTKSTSANLTIDGNIIIGNDVKIGYISQDTIINDNNISAYEFITSGLDDIDRSLVFTLLNNFGFNYDDRDKKYSELSPGQRTRVNLAKIALHKINVLILDEITNHLDKEALELIYELVESYPGTIISISHNRKYNEILNADYSLDISTGNIEYLQNNTQKN